MKVQDVHKFDQQMNLIFHGILAGPLLFYAIGYLQTLDSSSPSFEEPSVLLKGGVSLFSGILVLIAYYLYNQEMVNARTLSTLTEKLQRLSSAMIMHFAVLKVASLAAVVAFFLTHDHIFTAVYVTILFIMSIKRPTVEKYAKDLRLQGEERKAVLDKKVLEEE